MAQVFAVVNQKGGVGKTTTAVNLSAALADAGRRVLLIDCDPQANATRSVGQAENPELSLYDLLVGGDEVKAEEVILATGIDGLSLLPSAAALSGAEVELVNLWGRETRLRQALEPVLDRFDYILMDCPPSLGLISVNALVAAGGVLVPVQCEYLSLEGLGMLMRTLELVQRRLNPQLAVSGLIMTMFDPRTRLSGEVVAEVGRHFPQQRFDTVIPRNIRLGEAPSYGETVHQYAPQSAGAIAYRALAAEFLSRFERPS